MSELAGSTIFVAEKARAACSTTAYTVRPQNLQPQSAEETMAARPTRAPIPTRSRSW